MPNNPKADEPIEVQWGNAGGEGDPPVRNLANRGKYGADYSGKRKTGGGIMIYILCMYVCMYIYIYIYAVYYMCVRVCMLYGFSDPSSTCTKKKNLGGISDQYTYMHT
jgi:hypothetical protein